MNNGKKKENLIDEGLRVEFIKTAFFDGVHEIPHVEDPEENIIPDGMVLFRFVKEV